MIQAQWAEPLVLLGLGLGFNTTFNNISIISCLLVLLVEETEISRMNIRVVSKVVLLLILFFFIRVRVRV